MDSILILSLFALLVIIIYCICYKKFLKINPDDDEKELDIQIDPSYIDPIGRPLAISYDVLRHPQLMYQPNPTFSIFGRCI